eukprot:CAMPEP_0201487270 /NCGR_PEP_ID=MMETSP0151_2-20130828/12096_1 /ASSEMBLY_ACC=CAM_ASM_000257 /TAXON_ID=200890 /ORGANISM="Paramoeba atlantica, Strain 621/1 / CCAP 1560/9" /LENGTH=73 /DNA_ID=CAMNT_0047872267 /DNA_START=35 /DNA_END=256 /DNA_ORIENTATION=+
MSHNAFKNSGLSFLRYVSLSSSMMRNCLRPGLKEKALLREELNTVVNIWEGGKPQLQGVELESYFVDPAKGFK